MASTPGSAGDEARRREATPFGAGIDGPAGAGGREPRDEARRAEGRSGAGASKRGRRRTRSGKGRGEEDRSPAEPRGEGNSEQGSSGAGKSRGGRESSDGGRGKGRGRSRGDEARAQDPARGGEGRGRSGAGRGAKRALPDLPPPKLITTTDELEDLMDRLADEPVLAVDTEADSFFSYQEKVCLIQISSATDDFIVDPLGDIDLAPLGEMLADEGVEKLFHDGEFDVLLLKRHAGFEFRGLFDTRVAAAALGYEALGLAPLLSQEFGVELDKSQQMSDWSKRPLTPEQLAYARLDTHYLIELAEGLKAQLAKTGRGIVVDGECRRLEALEAAERVFQPNEFMRLKGSKTLDMKQLAVLKACFAERDRIASERDVPPFKVVAHPALVELARRSPGNLPQLAKVPGFSPKVIKRVGEAMLDAVERGKEAGPLESAPRLPSKQGTDGLDEFGLELWERLKTCRKRIAEREDMDSSLVLNRHVLIAMAHARPADAVALAQVPGIQSWQLELHGEAWMKTVGTFLDDLEQGRIEPRSKRRRGR